MRSSLNKGIKTNVEVRKAKKHFLNTAIYTIGYEGRKLKDFIQILKDNQIGYLMDIRFINESPTDQYFGNEMLPKALESAKIHYIHKKEFGILQ